MAKIASEYTEKRLTQWADWYGRLCDFGLGYPRRSVEGRLRDDGGVLIAGTGLKLPPTNTEAEEVETLLVELGQMYPDRANAVKTEYLSCEPVRTKARKLNMNPTQFMRIRDLGLSWLDGRLQIKSRYKQTGACAVRTNRVY